MNPIVKPYIIPGSETTWMDRNNNGYIIHPVARQQTTMTCGHHSLCPAIETAHQAKWSDSKENYHKLDHTVDVDWLVSNFPPPITAEHLIDALKTPKWGGKVKATGVEEYPFKVTGSKVYHLGPNISEDERLENLKIVWDHLDNKTPVLGSFYPSPNIYDTSKVEVYDTDFEMNKKVCPECSKIINYRHSVCVVGRASAMFEGGAQRAVFQYLESEGPDYTIHYQKGGAKGECYMTVESMYSITIPEFEEVSP